MKKILMALALMPFMALAVTIGDAIDAPQMTFTTGGSANWFGQTSVSHDGVDAAQSGAISDSQSAWMQTTFDGAADVSFWWKVSSESGYDHLRFYLDGTEQGAISGETGWAQKSFHVSGAGSHTLKWTYSKDGSVTQGSDCGWVDQLSVVSPIAEALDAPQMTFTTGGDVNWFGQTSVSHDGVDAAQSGAISDSQSTWMQTTFTGEKDVSFWWKVSSESGYDYLRFYLDGTEQGAISGETGWAQKSFHVTGTGTHTLKWTYSKDYSALGGSDCGWVDQLSVVGIPQTFYVNDTTGSDDNPGTSPESAKKTIQAAIDVSADGDTILVAPGTYAPIATNNKRIDIVSSEGRDVTIIDGQCERRCADLGSERGDTNTVLRGFSIVRGYTSAQFGSGVCCGQLQDCYVGGCTNSFGIWNSIGGGAWGVYAVDCEFRQNKATHGGGMGAGWATRCIIRDNYAEDDGGGLHDVEARDCLLVSNSSGNCGGGSSGAASAGGPLYNVTVVGNRANGGGGIIVGKEDLYNCIVFGNTVSSGSVVIDATLHDCFTADPHFIDAANGNYRLAADSPCIDAGNNDYVMGGKDLDGNVRISNGIVDIGCYEYQWPTPILYVNAAIGSDDNPGTTPALAKKTIQAAIDISEDGDTILVAPGTYDKFTSSNNCIRVESSDGPFNTIINGSGVSTVTNIMRLNGGIDGGTNTFVVGFTIQHLTRIDGGTIRRCIVRDNDTSRVGGGALVGAVAENCLILNNRGMNGAVSDGSILRNCTMVGNSASSGYDGVCLNSVLENCIVYGNANNERQTWQYWFERSWLAHWDHREIKVFDRDPKFVDAANGDYHLSEDSDCINFGDNRYAFMDLDLDGNVRIMNGVVDIGCYEYGSHPPIGDGLVAHYEFNGNAKDSSGYGNDGVVHGATLTMDRFGNADGAYSFDGNSVIQAADSASLSSITGHVSMSAWVRIDEWQYVGWSDNRAPLVFKQVDTGTHPCQYGWFVLNGDVLANCSVVNKGSRDDCFFDRDVPMGVWFHLALSEDSNGMSVYINGRCVGVSDESAEHLSMPSDLYIGNSTDDTGGLIGAMDDIRIYNRALSAVEVKELYDSEKPPAPVWTVSFDAQGGVASQEAKSVTNNTAIGELPTAELFGYDLLGWYSDAEGGVQVTPETIITNDVTFYAHWEKADLGVDYVLGGHWETGTTASGSCMIFSGLDETAEGGLSVRLKSEDDCETWIETTVTGEMWLSFDWKTSCETYEELELDRIEFSIDGHRQTWANGETDWTNLTFAVRGEGEHTIRFTYVKDESESAGEDSAWVANVTTAPKTAVATPVIDLAGTYATESTTCTITTETEGATIRYKFEYYGDESEWFEYTGPFEISGTTKVIAYATKQDYYDSEAVSASTERTMPWTLAECVNAPHLDFVTGGDGEWKRTTTTTHDGVAAIRSGEIATGKQSWVKVQMLGPGTISFWWKADSAYYKKSLLDYATFKVDGKEIGKIGGTSDWERVTHDVTGDGLHTYLWTYTKTAKTAMGEDCAWLDEVVWTPDTTGGVVVPTVVTGGKAVTVDTDWKDVELDEKFGPGTREKFEKRYGADLTAALLKPTGKSDVHGNDRSVWQDNVMGTDPTDKTSEFKSVVTMENGVPVITWDPDLGIQRTYKIWGRESLVDGDWVCPTNSTHRFFKVTVEMP